MSLRSQQAAGADVNAVDGFERDSGHYATVFNHAFESGNFHHHLTYFMLEHGAELNPITTESKRRPAPIFDAASDSCGAELVEALIAHGAEATVIDAWGNTPLHYAVRRDVTELLVREGVDPLAKNVDYFTALHEACARGFSEVLEVLLSMHLDLNAKAGVKR